MSKLLTVSNGKVTMKIPESTFKRWGSLIVDNKTVPRQGFKVVADVELSEDTQKLVDEVTATEPTESELKVPAAVAKAVKKSTAKKS